MLSAKEALERTIAVHKEKEESYNRVISDIEYEINIAIENGNTSVQFISGVSPWIKNNDTLCKISEELRELGYCCVCNKQHGFDVFKIYWDTGLL